MANKSFKSNLDTVNSALRFISSNQVLPDSLQNLKRENFNSRPLHVETKSRRLQLLLKPSLYENIKTKAYNSGVSINELVHSILIDYFK